MMIINQPMKQRIIKQQGISMPCYFFNYFQSPGLNVYPPYSWVNEDYNLIKTKTIANADLMRIVNNFYQIMINFELTHNFEYIIMMPLKPTSTSNMKLIITKLLSIIKTDHPDNNLQFLDDLFVVKPYSKFWKNKLKLEEREKAIKNKITLKSQYYHFFDDKKILIIDDIVSSGTSIAYITNELLKYNKNITFTALCYGSVYKWELIYK